MGKYISTGNRAAAPIFPKMPSAEQRMNTAPKERTEPKKPEEKAPKNVAVNVKQNVGKVKNDTAQKRKHLTSDDLRQGFKMSVILGEPVSRKYHYGRKNTK